MTWTKGNAMSDRNQRIVCDRFAHRMTVEACKRWPEFAASMRKGGYRMPDRTDAEWLASTEFYITLQGELSVRHNYCRTHWTPEQLEQAR